MKKLCFLCGGVVWTLESLKRKLHYPSAGFSKIIAMRFKVQNENWFKPKKYLHFDLPLNESDRERVKIYVSDPELVAKHAFFPFITYESTKYKMIEDDDGVRHLDDSGVRPISYASHWDSQIYSYYADLMKGLYELKLSEAGVGDNVIAFRKLVDLNGESKCNIHLANEAFEKIRSLGECKVYAFDIKSFFDRLDHDYLKDCWCNLLGETRLPKDHFKVYKSLATHALVKRSDLYKEFNIPKKNPKNKGFHRICGVQDFRKRVRGGNYIKMKTIGIPQGSPISALLANIYMFEFDKMLQSLISQNEGEYFRYCDDILCILPIDKDIKLETIITNELQKINLDLNSEKTESATFLKDIYGDFSSDKPIQYLGFLFDGKRKLIRTSSLSRYRRKAKKSIRLAKATMRKYNNERSIRGLSPRKLYRKKLYRKYFHTGRINFIRYALRAADIMESKEIRGQVKRMIRFLLNEIEL